MVITSSSQQAVLNISSLFKDSSYFAYIVTNRIGCVHLHEENAETEPTFFYFLKTKKTRTDWTKKIFLIENAQILSGLKDHLILSEAHSMVMS